MKNKAKVTIALESTIIAGMMAGYIYMLKKKKPKLTISSLDSFK